MPPIPVHIDDPITPTKAKGVVPQKLPHPGTATVSTTSTAQSQSSPQYPAAQPGAAAVPAPTPSTPNSQPAPLSTRTKSLAQSHPPPPQPGTMPVPSGQYAPQAPSTLPPPPKAGEILLQQRQDHGAQETPFTKTLPPPQLDAAPTSSTSTTTTPLRRAALTTLDLGAVGNPGQMRTVTSEHPSGYQQNIHAQELSPAARASLDQQERTRRPSFAESLGFSPGGAGSGQGLGGIGGMGNSQDMSEMAGKAWESAKKWFGDAGSKLAETEEEVWRRINGK